jgi:hypothetical protein
MYSGPRGGEIARTMTRSYQLLTQQAKIALE